jgi:hypothetical protein
MSRSKAGRSTCQSPGKRLEADGAEVHDWLKLIASEQRFMPDSFELPNLDRVWRSRGAVRGRGPRTVLDRIADRAVTRDAGDEAMEIPEWTTALVTLHTARPDSLLQRGHRSGISLTDECAPIIGNRVARTR